MKIKDISKVVNIKPKRLWDLITHYVDTGSFKKSQSQKSIEKTPIETIDFAIN